MVFDADRVARGLTIVAVALVALGLGVVSPKLLIPDVQSGVELEYPEAQRHVESRFSGVGGFGQKAMRVKMSIIDSRPDPTGCEWDYPASISQTVTVRTYSLWGIPLETWELTCNSERLVGGPLSW